MESISLQCPVTIKVKVTENFRAKMLDKFNVKVGDKMPAVMNTEIIVEDEKIIEIRN